MPDSCYLCEIGKEGVLVPVGEHAVLICDRCVLECIWRHPRLLALTERQRHIPYQEDNR